MDNTCLLIKKHIEEVFDIPFVVKAGKEYNDPYYIVFPENELEELFSVKILFRQNIRMIIEIHPQKYAAEMIKDMQNADQQKRNLFCKYIQLFKNNHAKVDMYINRGLANPSDENVWEQEWKQFRMRATKILSEGEGDLVESIARWAELSVGMMLTLLKIERLEQEERKHAEGKISQVLINKYERNPINRQLCLAANGYSCKICGFDFAAFYGELGKNFIHVHHIEMVSSFGGEYYLDPQKDLIPVCPNCHAMLHKMNPPIQPELLQEIIISNKEKQGDCK